MGEVEPEGWRGSTGHVLLSVEINKKRRRNQILQAKRQKKEYGGSKLRGTEGRF